MMSRYRRLQFAIKRALDFCAALLGLLLLLPVLAILALWTAAFMGRPVLFTQARIGKGGRVFNIYKFRTMTSERDGAGNLLPDERRLTRFGRFLRRSSLDELPEIFNVLIGDMSIVGPRPLLKEYRDLYTAEQWRRHSVPAGIAGPVTASGRNTLSWDEKFALDLWYVDNWSLGLDVKILFRTLWKAALREGVNAEGFATMPRFEGGSRARSEPPRGRLN